jgi:AcrR family transcriptional regulator
MNAVAAQKRDPDKTRQTLLQAAFDEIYRHGFQGASLDRILEHTGVTKGALYHHFRNKLELGYAVIEEVIRPWLTQNWIQAMAEKDDPLDALLHVIEARGKEHAVVGCHCGCPLNNLAQEMSPLDEGFRSRIEGLFNTWRRGLAAALRKGQAHGKVREGIDVDQVATFILASIEGSIGLAKNSQSMETFQQSLAGLKLFLDSLRPAPTAAAATA